MLTLSLASQGFASLTLSHGCHASGGQDDCTRAKYTRAVDSTIGNTVLDQKLLWIHTYTHTHTTHTHSHTDQNAALRVFQFFRGSERASER